jgi:hypothetical protein
MRYLLLIGLLLSFVWALPVYGQDFDCDIDLTPIYDSLGDLEAAIDNGNLDNALAALDHANLLLDRIPDDCTALSTVCTVSTVDNCVEILEITFSNGETLKPGDELTVSPGEVIRVESLTYSVTGENLQIIRDRHGRLSFAYAYVFPVVETEERYDLDQATQPGGAVNPLAATEEHSLDVRKNDSWTIESNWQHLVILVMHESPNEVRVESPVGRAFIPLNIQDE